MLRAIPGIGRHPDRQQRLGAGGEEGVGGLPRLVAVVRQARLCLEWRFPLCWS
jgi:hypothetical protein